MAYDYNHKAPTSYPSPADVRLFIKGDWLDDAYRIDYNVSTPRTPLYDYTSKFYKDVAEGHTLVQGQLIINYRFPNYLRTAIEHHFMREPGVLKTLRESTSLYQDLAEGDSETKVRKLIELKRLGALKPAKQVSQGLYGHTPGIPDVHVDPLSSHDKTVISQSDIVTFDIEIWYGGDEALYSHTIRDCVIIGEGQVISAAALAGGDLSASSMPIFEVYNFFGKKVDAEIKKKAVNHYGPLVKPTNFAGS